MISFKPLEHMLIDRDMNKAKLGRICGFSPSTLNRFSKGDSVTLKVLERVCQVLDCRIQDVVEFLPDEEEVKTDEITCSPQEDDPEA